MRDFDHSSPLLQVPNYPGMGGGIGPTGYLGTFKKGGIDNLFTLEGKTPFGWGGISAFKSSLHLTNFISEELGIKAKSPLKNFLGS